MMRLRLALLGNRLRGFIADERGTVTIETIFMVPFLAWCYVATLLFFDAFKDQAAAEKAAYTIADMVTREEVPVTPTFITSLHRLQRFWTDSDDVTRLRITAFSYDAASDDYVLHWSQTRGPDVPEVTDAILNSDAWTSGVPLMYDGEVLVAVETWATWKPWARAGLFETTFNSFVVTRPRYAPQVCYSDNDDPDIGNIVC